MPTTFGIGNTLHEDIEGQKATGSLELGNFDEIFRNNNEAMQDTRSEELKYIKPNDRLDVSPFRFDYKKDQLPILENLSAIRTLLSSVSIDQLKEQPGNVLILVYSLAQLSYKKWFNSQNIDEYIADKIVDYAYYEVYMNVLSKEGIQWTYPLLLTEIRNKFIDGYRSFTSSLPGSVSLDRPIGEDNDGSSFTLSDVLSNTDERSLVGFDRKERFNQTIETILGYLNKNLFKTFSPKDRERIFSQYKEYILLVSAGEIKTPYEYMVEKLSQDMSIAENTGINSTGDFSEAKKMAFVIKESYVKEKFGDTYAYAKAKSEIHGINDYLRKNGILDMLKSQYLIA